MRRTAVVVSLVGLMVASVAAMGCGNGIEAGAEPEVTVETEEITIEDMNPNGARSLQSDLQLRNDGDGELQVTNIEWIAKPERVEAYYAGPETEDDDSCTTDADCSGDGICLTQPGQCRDRGFRDLSDTVPPGATFDQALAVVDADGPVECAEPENPEEAPLNYCGEIRVETNAHNTTEVVDEGAATIYLLSDGSSGQLQLSETWLQYTFATRGTTQTKQFEIINGIDTPLEMERMDISPNADWFEATPRVGGLVIDGNSSETITLEMTPPEDGLDDEDDFEMSTSVTFASSSVDPEPGMTVEVTSGPGDVPVIDVEPDQLSFADDTTQTLTVSNQGGATLMIRDMSISPETVEDAYSVTYDGQEMLQDDPDNVIIEQAGDEPTLAEFEVELTDPDADTLVGDLRIDHNDGLNDNRSTVQLLGDEHDVAVGEIQPGRIDLRMDAGQSDPEIRYLGVANHGNEPLEIEGIDIDGLDGDAGDYSFEQVDGSDIAEMTVAPGDIEQLMVTYDGIHETMEQETLNVTVESNHSGVETAMQFNVFNSHVGPSGMQIEIAPGFPEVAQVGEQTSFAVSDETGQARLDHAGWYTLSRPADSDALLGGVGEQATFIPDVAGDYLITVFVDDGEGRELQETFEFEAVE